MNSKVKKTKKGFILLTPNLNKPTMGILFLVKKIKNARLFLTLSVIIYNHQTCFLTSSENKKKRAFGIESELCAENKPFVPFYLLSWICCILKGSTDSLFQWSSYRCIVTTFIDSCSRN